MKEGREGFGDLVGLVGEGGGDDGVSLMTGVREGEGWAGVVFRRLAGRGFVVDLDGRGRPVLIMVLLRIMAAVDRYMCVYAFILFYAR